MSLHTACPHRASENPASIPRPPIDKGTYPITTSPKNYSHDHSSARLSTGIWVSGSASPLLDWQKVEEKRLVPEITCKISPPPGSIRLGRGRCGRPDAFTLRRKDRGVLAMQLRSPLVDVGLQLRALSKRSGSSSPVPVSAGAFKFLLSGRVTYFCIVCRPWRSRNWGRWQLSCVYFCRIKVRGFRER
jgi:hypothetical protein